MSFTVYIVMFGWIPTVLLLFVNFPPRQAVIVSFIASWLFLPVVSFPLPGLPDYTKTSATTMGVLLGVVFFDARRLLAVRPRWFDLPILIWCLCPLASSLANGLGPYDGFSCALSQTISWGLPYLIGRLYLDDLNGMRALAVGLVVGGLIYAPLCLWEIRMSPQLHRVVYGFEASSFGMTIRFDGYRPMVFMAHGLELGMWMTAASLAGVWLWSSGALKRFRGVPFGRLLLGLLVTTVLCKSTGSLVLLVVGVLLREAIKWTKLSLPVWLLIAVAPFYEVSRATGLWSGRELVGISQSAIDGDRAGSLDFRMNNENMLSAKAMRRPLFGWGGWGRARVYNEEGKDISITDGYWIIVLGNTGLVGLAALTTMVLLPLALLTIRYAVRSWTTPEVAPAAVLAVLLGLYMIDNLSNAMYNPIYILAIGGLTALGPGRLDAGSREDEAGDVIVSVDGKKKPRELLAIRQVALAEHWVVAGRPEEAERVWRRALVLWQDLVARAPHDFDRRQGLALACERFGRFLKQRGRPREAVEVWEAALELLAGLAVELPDHPEIQRRWLDAHNDLAWLLITHPEPNPHDAPRALQLAKNAVGLAPECATYWNTLGIAHYRTRDWKAAITELEKSVELGTGGTSFDYYFLAMAYWRQGEQEQARTWYHRADLWMEKHKPDHADLLRFQAEAVALLETEH